MGGWAVAQSPILGTTITLERLRKRDYESLLENYEKIAPHLNEPLYTRPGRVGKGISAQASHRTVLDSLPSHGSCHTNLHVILVKSKTPLVK